MLKKKILLIASLLLLITACTVFLSSCGSSEQQALTLYGRGNGRVVRLQLG